jgi:TolB-like protein
MNTPNPSFFAELQRRHVYKVGATYGVAGWLLVQIATQVLPVFDVSALAQRLIVVAIVAGFPVSLILAWIFDLTPQGIVRTTELGAGAESPAASNERRRMDRMLNYVFGGLLLLAASYIAAERAGWAPGHAARPAQTDAKSIAVLPFENLSRDPDNAFFAEGIQDQVLTQLAKIGALKVISRTSTQQYAAKPASLGEIAAQLGVANILEGSVQRAGDAVRINVQLIRADGDSHLWAETYDRKLDNIFGIESEVATAIAEALNARLSGTEKQELARLPTHNPQAWEAYLRGVTYHNRGETRADELATVQAFETATQLDPDFALAWAWLSRSHAALYINLQDTSAARRDAAREALQRAQQLQPDSSDTRMSEGLYDYWVERKYDDANAILEKVRIAAPNDGDVPFSLALIARRQGRWEQSLAHMAEAVDIDPRNIELLEQAAVTCLAMRSYAEAQLYLDRAKDLEPGNNFVLTHIGAVFQMQGRMAQADAILAGLNPDAADTASVSVLLRQHLLQHRYAQGAMLIQQMIGRLKPSDQFERAYYHAQLGAFQQLAGTSATARASLTLARDEAEALLREQPDNDFLHSSLGLVYARLGERDTALQHVRKSIELVSSAKDALTGPSYEEALARVLALFGDEDTAIPGVQHLLAIPYGTDYYAPITPTELRLDPDWDRLRSDARFQKLIANGAAPT